VGQTFQPGITSTRTVAESAIITGHMAQIASLLGSHQTYSYEFFPPKDEQQAVNLEATLSDLSLTRPDFISVTCGALGSPQDLTRDVVVDANSRYDFPAMPHLTCVGRSEADIQDAAKGYVEAGVENILALRGDLKDEADNSGNFAHAIDLATALKSAHPDLSVGVAAHPEVHPKSPNRAMDRQYLAAKLGVADFAITQFFFGADHYARLLDELDALGCNRPIIPGIMLFNGVAGLRRIAGMNNTSIPGALNEQLDRFSDPADIRKLAVDTAARLVTDLRRIGIPGIHVYTLNKSGPALELHGLLSH
jgi:methylenetetrahydrofolate reductase (NADPH)